MPKPKRPPVQRPRTKRQEVNAEYADLLMTMQEECEARGLDFREEMTDLVRAWFDATAPGLVPPPVPRDPPRPRRELRTCPDDSNGSPPTPG